MTDYTIPRANAPIAGTEAPTIQWYNYLRFLDTRTSSASGDVQAEITTIAEKLGSPDGTVDNIPPQGNVRSVQGLQSVTAIGASIVQLALVNDVTIVDPVYYYGTDSTGTKGYNLLYSAFASTANIAKINTAGIVSFDLTDLADSGAGTLLATTFDAKGRKTGSRVATITGTAGRITVANGDASAGLPTIDLATVTDAGGGALLRFVRDAWGRISGTSAATTSDLAEGSNLYFTTGRVLATLLAGLSTATSAAITAADSVLIAFGKLQAQIATLTASLTGYVPTTRTITAGTGLSGGGDLSANRSFAITNTAVTAASYGDTTHVATFTVNAQGQLTLAGAAAIAFPVTTVFGRSGAVVAAANDYTFAQLASKPTTLAGYGITDALATITPAGYIDGLKMVWNSATSISATSGTCYIQGSSSVVSFPSLLTLSGLSLTASTWYHLYAYLNSGTPAIELVTTAPAAAYSGTARSKTADTSRRYLGSVLTDASGNVYNFYQTSKDLIMYQANINGAPFIVVVGTATVATSVSCAAVVPLTARIAKGFLANNDAAKGVFIGNSSVIPSSTNFTCYVGISPCISTIDFPLDSTTSFQYIFSGTPTANFVARITGYYLER